MSYFFTRGKFTFLVIMWLTALSFMKANAQSVGIGTPKPNGHAVLDITSQDHTQGFLMPRLTSAERMAMPLGKDDIGMMVFDIDLPGLVFWDGTQWVTKKESEYISSLLLFNPSTAALSIEGGNTVDLSSLMNNAQDELISGVDLQSNQLTIREGNNDNSLDLGLLELNGDVEGSLENTQVTGIQGYPVNAANPQPGDRLIFDGTAWTVETAEPLAVSPRYYTVAPGDFVALYDDEVSVDKNNALIFASDNSFVTIRHNNEGRQLMAPIHLPHGATINQVIAHYFDDHMPNLTIMLVEIPIGATMNIIEQAVSSENQAGMATRVMNTDVQIDNQNFTYAILVDLDVSSETKNPGADAEQGIYGVVIEYIDP